MNSRKTGCDAWKIVGQPDLAGWKEGFSHRALFLDRDGVINVDHGYVHTPEKTDWIPGIFEICHLARAAGFLLIIVTNQAGIGHGYYTEAHFRKYTGWIHQYFCQNGTPIVATYYCPEHPQAQVLVYRNASLYRKPQPGMLLAASRDWSIDLASSVMVGDKESDIEAARRAHVGQAFLVGQRGFSEVKAWFHRLPESS